MLQTVRTKPRGRLQAWLTVALVSVLLASGATSAQAAGNTYSAETCANLSTVNDGVLMCPIAPACRWKVLSWEDCTDRKLWQKWKSREASVKNVQRLYLAVFSGLTTSSAQTRGGVSDTAQKVLVRRIEGGYKTITPATAPWWKSYLLYRMAILSKDKWTIQAIGRMGDLASTIDPISKAKDVRSGLQSMHDVSKTVFEESDWRALMSNIGRFTDASGASNELEFIRSNFYNWR